MSDEPGQLDASGKVRATAVTGDVKVVGDADAEPARRTPRTWLTRDDRDHRAIE